MKKKLRLAKLTISHLTSTDLQSVAGAATGPTEGVGSGPQSYQVGTKWEPCPAATGGCITEDYGTGNCITAACGTRVGG